MDKYRISHWCCDNTLTELNQQIELHKYKGVYVLIDPRAGDSPIDLWRINLDNDCHWIIRDPQDKDSSDNECLQLLFFNVEQLSLLLQQDATFYQSYALCGYLLSHNKVEQICEHLTMLLNLRYGGQYYQFRYYDPRVLGRLIDIFTEEQLDIVLGPLSGWLFFDISKQPVFLSHLAQLVVGDNLIKVTPKQWKKMGQIEWTNQAIVAYQQITPTPLSVEQHALLEKTINEGQHLGITLNQDMLALTQFSLILDSSVISDLQVKLLIQQSVQTKTPLIDLFDQQPEDFWHKENSYGI